MCLIGQLSPSSCQGLRKINCHKDSSTACDFFITLILCQHYRRAAAIGHIRGNQAGYCIDPLRSGSTNANRTNTAYYSKSILVVFYGQSRHYAIITSYQQPSPFFRHADGHKSARRRNAPEYGRWCLETTKATSRLTQLKKRSCWSHIVGIPYFIRGSQGQRILDHIWA